MGRRWAICFMSLIHTCQLCDANSFDYLTELQRHAQEVVTTPAEWMPWNYRETLERTVPLSDSA
jgi:transposase